ncbi:MAG: ABC transporter permease subunit [Micrococcales bacterium]|nr:ABC transporter permease subunit [Micrococcales bacterium]
MPRVGIAPGPAARGVILGLAALFFLVPLIGLAEFSLRVGQPVDGRQAYGFLHVAELFAPATAGAYQLLFDGIGNSLLLCVLTIAIVLLLLLPAMILSHLRYPRVKRVLEFVCLLPITVPTIVLVVGFVPVYSVVAQLFGSPPWTLAFAIGVIVLPFAYRPIAANMGAVELHVLTEASRSLGASWGATLARIILPNLRRGIFAAAFITIAVVLGEYTIASFLAQNTFQTALVLLQRTDPYVATIFSLLAIMLGIVLLIVIGRVGAARPGTRASRRIR